MEPDQLQNARKFALGEGIWGLGIGLIAPLTVFPLLLKALGAKGIELGLVFSLATAGVILTQPLGLLLPRKGKGRKRFLILYHCFVVLPATLLMGALIWTLGGQPGLHLLLRWLLIGVFGVRILVIGVIVPLWQDWFASLFNRENRGQATGMYAAASAIGVSLAAVVAAYFRSHLPFPGNYAVLFFMAVFLFAISMGVFMGVSSGNPSEGGPERPELGEMMAMFRDSLRDNNYRSYLVTRVLLTVGAGATAFFAVRFRSPEGGELSDATIIGLGALLTMPQALASYWLGRRGDKKGHRSGVLIGATAQTGAIAFAFFGSGAVACALCFICLGVGLASGMVSHQNMVYETCPHDNRVAHITLSNLALSPFVLLMPVALGWLVGEVGLTIGIGTCLIPTVAGAVWTVIMVDEPRQLVLGKQSRRLPAWLEDRRSGRDGEKTSP